MHGPDRRVASGRRGAAPERHRGLDGLGHPSRLGRGGERAEVERAVVAHRPHDRQPREGLAQGELEVPVARPVLGLAVEPWLVLVDEAHLGDRGLECAGAHLVVDRVHLAQQLAHLPAIVAREVRADPRAQVGGLAHVEHPPAPVTEEVDARGAGERGGERELGHLGVTGQLGQGQQVVEAGDAEPAGPLEQHVEQVGGGQRVVEGAVVGAVVEPQAGGKGAEPAVGHLVAHQAAGQGTGVDPGVRQPGPPRPFEGHPQEPEVEPDVVADDHGVADELEEGREHGFDPRCGHDHRLADAGQHRDLGRDGHARVDQRLERAEADRRRVVLTAPISVMPQDSAEPPVVSRSITQKVTS